MSIIIKRPASLSARTATASLTTQHGRIWADCRFVSYNLHIKYPRSRSLRDSFRMFAGISTPQHSPLRLLSSIQTLRLAIPSSRHFYQQHPQFKQNKASETVQDPRRNPDAKDSAASGSAEETSESSSSEQRSSASDKKSSEQDGREENQDSKKQENKKKSDEPPPPPPHGDKSPLQVFMDTLRSEFKASKEWNEGTKALASSAHDFTQNETLKKAKSAYTTVTDATTSTTGKVLTSTGKAIGQGAAWTWDTLPVKGLRAGVNATASGLEKITRPVRETDAYKSVRDVIDDGSSLKYGGWQEKEQRRKRREAREMEEASRTGRPLRKSEKLEEDLNAGTNVTLHKDSAWKESWKKFQEESPVMQSIFSLKSTYAESENPLISTARSITDRVAGFFAENETAMVIKKFREMDPGFQLEAFLQDMREYILPEILDAFVKGDNETLRMWLSAGQYQVYAALNQQYTQMGLISDGKILDIRNVDVLSARLLEPGDIPVFILTCRTQEVHTYRSKETGALAAGMEDRVQQVTYAIGVTRIPEDVSNQETRGWRLIELQKSASTAFGLRKNSGNATAIARPAGNG